MSGLPVRPLTHIDADHIKGLLPLINDRSLPVEVKQVWYNGFDKFSMLELYRAHEECLQAQLLLWGC